MKEEELKVNTFLILEGYQSGTKRFYGGTSLHTLIFSEIVYLPAYTFRVDDEISLTMKYR